MLAPNDRTPNVVIQLAGISNKGKQRIKQHGSAWRVIFRRDTVLFSTQRGPWLMVVPDSHGDTSEASRWVHALFDANFKVMP